MHTWIQQHGYRGPRSHPEEFVERSHRKETFGKEICKQEEMSYNQICLWFWVRFIAVPFYLPLSRVGEAENPGLVCATAKLFCAKYDAIGQWTQNLSNRSEVELEPLFTQVGECRQMSCERFGKDSKLYTSSVSQDIHSTHSHLDRSSLPVSPERDGDLAHTQQFCDYLSLFQEGEQSGSGQHVSSNLRFRGMEGQERSNPFCHRTARGGRKHTGKRRKLELSKGVVNILQCNVTTWSEHARHDILTSDFDAALSSETHLGKERLLSAVTEAKKSGWAGTGSAATNTVNNGTSAGVLGERTLALHFFGLSGHPVHTQSPGTLITLCLFLLSLNLISYTLINVVTTPFLKLPNRVAKVIMF